MTTATAALRIIPVNPAPKRSRKAVAKPPTLKQMEAQAKREEFELWLLRDIKAAGLPEPTRQALWHPTIGYKADLLFARERLMVEVDGGVYLRYGHHSSGKGYEYDRVRDAEALCLGYTVLRVTPGMVKDGTALTYVERVLHAIQAKPTKQAQRAPRKARNKRTA